MIRIDPAFLKPFLLGRENDSHKGDYGHLLIVAGCQRMPGAAVLATGAALRSGCGLVTLHSTERALQAAVNNCPSAMLSEDPGEAFSRLPASLDKYDAIAVGPGLGRAPETKEALLALLAYAKERDVPVVADADALNILSELPNWKALLPGHCVLTPHLGELGRLLPFTDETELAPFCSSAGCTLVRKGFLTSVFTPDGACLVNTTGNPGLAKGGSGDVLTGLVGGLLARGYAPVQAAALGVWIHGFAGDRLTCERTAEAWSSSDLVDRLYLGFKELVNTP